MGYGHYWGREANLATDLFEKFSGDVRRLIAAKRPICGLFGGIKIRGPLGAGLPLLDADTVSLNGRPRGETFWIPRIFSTKGRDRPPAEDGRHWDFVHTDHLPYDLVIVASLLSLKFHFPDSVLTTDGSPSDWYPGHEFFEQVTGRKIDLKTSVGPA